MRQTTLLLTSLFFAAACGNNPSQTPPTPAAPKLPVQTTPATTPASKPSSAPVDIGAKPTTPPAAMTTSAEAEDGPEIDCKRYPEEPAPSRRWLCNWAMAKSKSVLIDAQGFAMVTEFESPGEISPGAEDEGHIKKRMCGAAAEARVKELAAAVRFHFSIEEPAESTLQHVTCNKMSCMLIGMGEYSTNISLNFRSTPASLVLDSWTEIEVVLVDEAEVKRREKIIAKGLKELAKTTCKP